MKSVLHRRHTVVHSSQTLHPRFACYGCIGAPQYRPCQRNHAPLFHSFDMMDALTAAHGAVDCAVRLTASQEWEVTQLTTPTA